MMFETIRHQQESMRHLNRVMAESSRRPMNVPRPSIYHAPADATISQCPLCKATMDQYLDMHMASCGFCGTIISYDDNYTENKLPNLSFPKHRNKRKLSETAWFLLLMASILIAGLIFIFLPFEKLSFFQKINDSYLWTIIFSLIIGCVIVFMLYIILSAIKFGISTVSYFVRASRKKQYHF